MAVVIVVDDSYAPLFGPVTVPGLMAPAFAALVVEGGRGSQRPLGVCMVGTTSAMAMRSDRNEGW